MLVLLIILRMLLLKIQIPDKESCYSKDWAMRTVSDKVLNDRAYEIALNPQHDRY